MSRNDERDQFRQAWKTFVWIPVIILMTLAWLLCEEMLRPFHGTFLVEREWRIGIGNDYRICGIPVQFVPWLEGFFLLPKAK